MAELLGGDTYFLAEVAIEERNRQGIRRRLGESESGSIGCCFAVETAAVAAVGASAGAAFVQLRHTWLIQ